MHHSAPAAAAAVEQSLQEMQQLPLHYQAGRELATHHLLPPQLHHKAAAIAAEHLDEALKVLLAAAQERIRLRSKALRCCLVAWCCCCRLLLLVGLRLHWNHLQ
jgi:hypothetical protein